MVGPTPPPPAAAPTCEHAGPPETFVQAAGTVGSWWCPQALLPCALPPSPTALARRPGFHPSLGPQGTLQAVCLSWKSDSESELSLREV